MNRLVLFFLFPFLFVCSEGEAKGDVYVVVVGVSGYQEIPSLVLPEKDAKAIAALYKLQTKHVILITGKYATKAVLLKSLKDQFSRAKEDDMVVFAFSGHGYADGICPYDMPAKGGKGITYREIQSILKQSRASRKVLFLDACFSGGIRGNASGIHSHAVNTPDVLLFLSSRTGEASIESPFMANGVFTTYLLRGLRGGADADKNRKITAKELFRYVSRKVGEKTDGKQHPVMWGKFEDDTVLFDWNRR
ncbi:caspase domain-containing protein [Bacteroides sp. AN502(2024)]|uniref:caspase family protein n=1 Tax=Bacteroides sp. AN502(2024) TaxID=3160599 RepID=UPI0035175CBC